MPQFGPHNSPSTYFGLLDQSQKEAVLKFVAKESVARFKTMVDTIKEASAVRRLPAQKRLDAYRIREPQVWQRIQAKFPVDYETQMRDWYHLEKRIANAKHPDAAEETSLFGQRATAAISQAYFPGGA